MTFLFKLQPDYESGEVPGAYLHIRYATEDGPAEIDIPEPSDDEFELPAEFVQVS